jgi:aspartyl protease family protein
MSDSPIIRTMVAVVVVVSIAIFAADRLDRWSNSAVKTTKSGRQTLAAAKPSLNYPRNGHAAPRWGQVRIDADASGHYRTSAEINGRRIESVLVDTGASTVVLTYEDAESAGVFTSEADFTVPVQTANGVGRVAQTRLNRVQVGSVAVENVEAMVAERGVLTASLLGMNFLSRLSGFGVSDGALVLSR